MKQNRGLIIGIAGYLLVALIGYFWATALMSSVFDYRLPLRFTPPAPAAPLGTSLTHRVVIVLIDALRYDTSINNNVMSFLNSLRDQGASAIMHSLPPSYSEPGDTTILTGARPDLNDGPTVNLDYADIPISMLRLQTFRVGSRKAAETTLGFVGFIIYLLALPILVSFAVNGFVVTWTLPSFIHPTLPCFHSSNG